MLPLMNYELPFLQPELLSKPSWPQAMEYMINCKYPEAAQLCGHPVTTHSIILVSSCLKTVDISKQQTVRLVLCYTRLHAVCAGCQPGLISLRNR